MNIIYYRCPKCHYVSELIQIKSQQSISSVICPLCLKKGDTVQMTEQRYASYTNLGDGFFKKES